MSRRKEQERESQKQCAFCLRPAVVKGGEHIWSAWIGKLLPRTKYQFRKRLPNGRIVTSSGDRISFKVPVVCQTCNNTWMSEIENDHAKPVLKDMILHGGDVTLLPAGMASLSLFAFKLLVVANHNGEQHLFFTAKDRHRFAERLEIPQGVQVWIASRKSRFHHTGVFNSHFGKLPAGTNNAIDLYVCTWGIGHLLIQTAGVRWALRATRRRNVPVPTLRQNNPMNDAAIAVWPNQSLPIVWPPQRHIGDDTIDLFCDRWENLNFPLSLLNAATM